MLFQGYFAGLIISEIEKTLLLIIIDLRFDALILPLHEEIFGSFANGLGSFLIDL